MSEQERTLDQHSSHGPRSSDDPVPTIQAQACGDPTRPVLRPGPDCTDGWVDATHVRGCHVLDLILGKELQPCESETS